MAEQKFKIGQRVQINPKHAISYRQAWKARVAKGLFGEITDWNGLCYSVQLDVPKQAKYVHDWFWRNVFDADLLPAEGSDHG